MGHPETAVIPSLRRAVVRLTLALVAGATLALVVSWTASEAATTTTKTTPSTKTVTSTKSVTSTTTTTATGPTQTTTLTKTKTVAASAPKTSTVNHTTTVETAPPSQTGKTSSSKVPTWAWVVIGLCALAIGVLIVVLVRERDLRTYAERRAGDQASYRAASDYGSQPPGPGSQGPGPDKPTL